MEHTRAEEMLYRLGELSATRNLVGLDLAQVREYNFLLAFRAWLESVDSQVAQFEMMYEYSYMGRTCEDSAK